MRIPGNASMITPIASPLLHPDNGTSLRTAITATPRTVPTKPTKEISSIVPAIVNRGTLVGLPCTIAVGPGTARDTMRIATLEPTAAVSPAASPPNVAAITKRQRAASDSRRVAKNRSTNPTAVITVPGIKRANTTTLAPIVTILRMLEVSPTLASEFPAYESVRTRTHCPKDSVGMSAFALEGDVVYHTYSAYARGMDALWGMFQWLDRASHRT